MANGTKERILDTALEMFSKKGYSGTNMRELASAMGLTKAALYKHYESKEEIRDCLLDNIEAYYEENFGSKEHMPEIPVSADELIALTMRMVNFTIHDEKVVMVRKMLTIEQYADDRCRRLASQHFLTGLEELFQEIFKGMMANGLIRPDSPSLLAFAYTAPISVLIQSCDREPWREKEALEKIQLFAEHFIRTYENKTVSEMKFQKQEL